MRKPLALALAASMTLSLALAGCGTSATTETTDGGDSGSGEGGSAIELINGKPEIDAQLQDLAAKYEEETGNKITITTIGGGQTASDELKKRYQAENMPDIFVCEEKDFATWTEDGDAGLVDLSGEDWTNDTDLEYVSKDYGTIGFPYTVEAVGLGYNKDILEKAGIDPASLTSPDAFKDAFKKLDDQKGDLGLDAVIGYAANSTNISWSTGTHNFGQYLDCGLAYDDTTYIDMLNDGGKLDKDRFVKYAEFVGLIQQYADKNLMVNGKDSDQYGGFAAGKYAFITQGSWVGAQMTGTYKEDYEAAGSFKCGFVPYAFDDGCDTILGGPPSYWAVYAKGNVDASKEFLQWCSDDSAQQILVEQAGLVSPFSDCKYTAEQDPFAAAVTEWISSGKVSNWHTMKKKDGLEKETGVVYENYAKGKIKDAEEFYEKIQEVCTNYYAQ
jgi:raffinose/stachyose/melibiose transport system substrate-binding protein